MKSLESIFHFDDYKAYVLAREQSWPRRGLRKELAQAMGCQAAYVTQVLNGSGHFSLEQGERANPLFQHSRAEAHFFILLMQKERAGTPSLREYFLEQIKTAREENLNLKNRLDVKERLKEQDQVLYYSDPYFALVHVALTVPELNNVTALTQRLGIEEQKIVEIIEFLIKVGLVKKEGSRLSIGESRIHLGNDSKLILSHHRNWRIKAIDNLSFSESTDLQYSSVISLSRKDFETIRESLVRMIEKHKKTIRDSKEEDLAVFNIDFFRFKR